MMEIRGAIITIIIAFLAPYLIGLTIEKRIEESSRKVLRIMFEDEFNYSNYWIIGFVVVMIIFSLGLFDLFWWNLFMNATGYLE